MTFIKYAFYFRADPSVPSKLPLLPSQVHSYVQVRPLLKIFFWCYVMWGCKAATVKSIRVLWIPDPIFFHPGSWNCIFSMPDPIKELALTPKKLVLSSRKYDPGCSFRILDAVPDFFYPYPGVKKASGSGSATLPVSALIWTACQRPNLNCLSAH